MSQQETGKEGILATHAVAPRIRLKFFIENVVLILRIALIEPFHLLMHGERYRQQMTHRLGWFKHPTTKRALWIHAQSQGEVRLLTALAKAIPKHVPLVLTSWVCGPLEMAERALHDHDVVLTLLPPFSFGFATRRFLKHFDPCGLVLIEGRDTFPLRMLYNARQSLPCVVINDLVIDDYNDQDWKARAPLLALVDHFGVQTEEDRGKYLQLGLAPEKLTVTGDSKFDLIAPKPPKELASQLESVVAGRPLLIAGSTESAEEVRILLKAFRLLGAGEQAMLIVAPTLLERVGEVASLLTESAMDFVLRSALPASGRPDVVLLDSIGELASLYTMAQGAFIGGTLCDGPGHSPLEAAWCGVPITLGPSMRHFESIARTFDGAGAWRRIGGAEELAGVWASWLEAPGPARELGERGRALVLENRGALERSLEVMASAVELPQPIT